METRKTFHPVILGIGCAALALGVVVYLISRPAEDVYFIHRSPVPISLYSLIPDVFGGIAYHLPSFLHVFAFSMITAGLVSRSKQAILLICGGWFSVDFLFELGQKYGDGIVAYIPRWFEHVPFLENSAGFFVSGTFDMYDVAATALGAVSAYLLLSMMKEKGDRK